MGKINVPESCMKSEPQSDSSEESITPKRNHNEAFSSNDIQTSSLVQSSLTVGNSRSAPRVPMPLISPEWVSGQSSTFIPFQNRLEFLPYLYSGSSSVTHPMNMFTSIGLINDSQTSPQALSGNEINYKGVSWDKTSGSWRCKLHSTHIGYFKDKIIAAQAYDEAAMSLWEKLPNHKRTPLNFPDRVREGPSFFETHGCSRENQGTSIYRGVLWDKASKSWRAKIKFQGKTNYLGVYQDEQMAARAYDKAAITLRGNGAILNFPEESVGSLADPESIQAELSKVKASCRAEDMRQSKRMKAGLPAQAPEKNETKLQTLTNRLVENLNNHHGIKDAMTSTTAAGITDMSLKELIREVVREELQELLETSKLVR